MPLTKKPKYIKEPDPLQCGQAVLAMLSDRSVEYIIELLQNKKETTLKEMLFVLDNEGIKYKKERIEITNQTVLPRVCILSLETPRCWHWSLWFDGVVFDPEHGVLNDFPISNRKYYWEILG